MYIYGAWCIALSVMYSKFPCKIITSGVSCKNYGLTTCRRIKFIISIASGEPFGVISRPLDNGLRHNCNPTLNPLNLNQLSYLYSTLQTWQKYATTMQQHNDVYNCTEIKTMSFSLKNASKL